MYRRCSGTPPTWYDRHLQTHDSRGLRPPWGFYGREYSDYYNRTVVNLPLSFRLKGFIQCQNNGPRPTFLGLILSRPNPKSNQSGYR